MDPKYSYVSVDIETAGPIPGRSAMLSLGACLVADSKASIYLEFQPETMDYVPSPLAIGQLSMEELATNGVPLAQGMRQLADDLIIASVEVLEGPQEKEILKQLMRLKDHLADPSTQPSSDPVQAARAEVINLVNNFFYERLTGLPTIKEYMEGFDPSTP